MLAMEGVVVVCCMDLSDTILSSQHTDPNVQAKVTVPTT
jgi:hypothetical protein